VSRSSLPGLKGETWGTQFWGLGERGIGRV
jgi:hypothetical protein